MKTKEKTRKLTTPPEATVLAIPLDRIVLMTLEHGFLMIRMRGAWANTVPLPQTAAQKSGPSPTGIAIQAPDIAATLDGSSLFEESVDQLTAISDLRKSELWSGPSNEAKDEASAEKMSELYTRTRRSVTISTKPRSLEKFVTMDVSPLGALIAETAQLEGRLLARMRKTSEMYGEVKVHILENPIFRVVEKSYRVLTRFILWGEGAARVDMTDLEKE